MHRLHAQHGMTVVESLVAMTILLVGLGGGLKLLDGAASVTGESRAREQATSLARQATEAARSVPWARLTPSGTGARVQAADGDLADSSSLPGWNVRRRGVTYTLAVGACTVDSPVDGLGTKDPDLFCASGSGTATPAQCRARLGSTGSIAGTGGAQGDCGTDTNFDGTVDGLSIATAGCTAGCAATTPADTDPADAKRVVVLVRWDRGPGVKYVLQTSTIPFTGTGSAPQITGPTGPASITSGTSAAYALTTDRAAAAVEWSVDGIPVTAGASGSGTAWSLNWALGEIGATAPGPGQVLDGVTTISARAFDGATSLSGQERALTVSVNRRRPYALAGLAAGREAGAVLVEWDETAEGDVIGYRAFRRTGSGPVVVVCALTTATACRDAAPPAADTQYWAVAVDRDTAGVERLGDVPETPPVVRASNAAPSPPTQLKASRSADGVVLTWTASDGDPDAGDRVAFYRIYRDGQTRDDRLDRTLDETATRYTDGNPGSSTRTYYVSAVDTQLGESSLVRVTG